MPIDKKTKATEATVAIMSAAKELGFGVQLAIVWLEKDWDFSVEIEDFDQQKLYIDAQKRYDNCEAPSRID